MSRRTRFAALGAVQVAVAIALAAPAGAAGATLTIKSVPRLQGLDFVFAGHRYTTGRHGTVAIRVARPGTYSLRALPWRHVDRGLRVSFSRWGDDSFTAQRTVRVAGPQTLEVGYGISFRRGLRFYDCVGAETAVGTDVDETKTGCAGEKTRPVSPSRITSVTLASSIGQKVVLGAADRAWLEGVRVARRLHGLEETLIYYSVLHVRVAGSDVVNQAQQRFYLTPPPKGRHMGKMHPAYESLLIRLSLFDARFTTHDLLLRSPIGHALELTYPDGRKQVAPFHDGELTLKSLPRGLYHVQVQTKAGLKMTVPVSLSRNQDLQLKVISYFDIVGSFLVFALVSLALVTARRPTLRAAIRRRVARVLRARPGWLEAGR